MAPPVYSTQFLLLDNVAAATYAYTVPAGQIAIVRDMDLVAPAGSSAQIAYLAIEGAIIDMWAGITGALPGRQWRGRQVANPGQRVEIVTVVAGIYGALSGYLLSVS